MCKWQKKISQQQKKQSCYTYKTNKATKHLVVAQLVNKMRALIQQMKTVREPVTENLSKDSNTRVATTQKRQTKPDRKSSEALTSEGIFVAGPLQTPPKRKAKGTPPQLMGWNMVQNRKKIDPAQERELSQEKTDLSPWKRRLLFIKLGKCRWTPKWKMKN